MKNKLYMVVVFCLVMVLILSFSACTAPVDEEAQSTIEITDQLGRVVKLEKVPDRIISLAPSNTEILFALGLADRVVAVTDYDDYPPEVKEKPSIGGFSTPNIEEVVALSPDLILATSIHETRIIPQLEERELTVLALNPKTVDEVLTAITLVGQVTGKSEEASQLTAGMRTRIKAVTDKTNALSETERPRVFYVVWHDPLMIAGSGTLQDELIEKAGGLNISIVSSQLGMELTDYASISLETVIAINPEVMIAGVGMGTGEDKTFQYLKTESRLRNTEAGKNGRIYKIDMDLTGRGGPRIVDGLEQFARSIHPEIFGPPEN